MSKFGWSLPPGVTQRMIDEAYGGDEGPCQCCGHDPADCICPECSTCGEQGNLNCYKEPPLMQIALAKYNVSRKPHHGLKFSREQQIGQAKMRIAALKEQVQDEEMTLAYLEEHPEEDLT